MTGGGGGGGGAQPPPSRHLLSSPERERTQPVGELVLHKAPCTSERRPAACCREVLLVPEVSLNPQLSGPSGGLWRGGGGGGGRGRGWPFHAFLEAKPAEGWVSEGPEQSPFAHAHAGGRSLNGRGWAGLQRSLGSRETARSAALEVPGGCDFCVLLRLECMPLKCRIQVPVATTDPGKPKGKDKDRKLSLSPPPGE